MASIVFNTTDGKKKSLSIKKVDNKNYTLIDDDSNEYLSFQVSDSEIIPYNQSIRIAEDEDSIREKISNLLRDSFNQDQLGIEDDGSDNSTDELDPFNPEEVYIETRVFSMETLLRRLQQKTILLNPDFQRKEVWDNDRKSQLIESLLLKIPIPMFYVSADERSNWTVVDGLQRISAFRDFILGKKYMEDNVANAKEKGNGMQLTGMEFWKTLEGKRMNDLPPHLQNRVFETQFTFTIINPGTHEEVKRNIFKRLNTGGMPLSSQEIRNALYIGDSTKLLKELSCTKEFKQATCNSINALRCEDQELILRFLAFLVRKPETFRRSMNIDTWLSDTMIIINSLPALGSRELRKRVNQGIVNLEDINPVLTDDIKDLFKTAMARSMRLFGVHAFRKSTGEMRRRPINKSLFEVWGFLLAYMDEDKFAKLCEKRDAFMYEYQEILDNPNFIIAISRDSMKHQSVKLRFETIANLVNKYTN